jgi:hypothetical protein
MSQESSEVEIMWASKIGQSRFNAAIEAEEMNLFSILKPKLFKDGNQWCVLYGENLQEGIAGFGDTPRLAIYDFNKQWDRQESKP